MRRVVIGDKVVRDGEVLVWIRLFCEYLVLWKDLGWGGRR